MTLVLACKQCTVGYILKHLKFRGRLELKLVYMFKSSSYTLQADDFVEKGNYVFYNS